MRSEKKGISVFFQFWRWCPNNFPLYLARWAPCQTFCNPRWDPMSHWVDQQQCKGDVFVRKEILVWWCFEKSFWGLFMFIFVQFVKEIGMQLKTFIWMGPHFCNSVNKFFTRIETSVILSLTCSFFLAWCSMIVIYAKNVARCTVQLCIVSNANDTLWEEFLNNMQK